MDHFDEGDENHDGYTMGGKCYRQNLSCLEWHFCHGQWYTFACFVIIKPGNAWERYSPLCSIMEEKGSLCFLSL